VAATAPTSWLDQAEAVPHTLGVPPPPQVCGEVQVPQELTVREAPQLSVPLTVPQSFPKREQNVVSDSGVQLPPPVLTLSKVACASVGSAWLVIARPTKMLDVMVMDSDPTWVQLAPSEDRNALKVLPALRRRTQSGGALVVEEVLTLEPPVVSRR
jgi:hypothetical protein